MNDLRAEFPLLQNCVYLNSNSTGATPRGVEQVLRTYWENVSTWRDERWIDWLAQVDGYVDALGTFLGAPPGSIVTDLNLTTLLGRLATSLDFQTARNRVVVSHLEFPTIPFLWRGFARYGAELVVAGDDGPGYNIDALEDAIDERTLLVCVSHGSTRTGALLDLDRIIARAHAHGAMVAIDAYQTVGAVPLDLQARNVDFALGGAHKWMCGAHTAFLYVRPDLLAELRPAVTGWFAGDAHLTFGESADWAKDARRFAGGTPIPLTAMMSRVGLDLLAGIGVDAIRKHSLTCTDRIIERADKAGLEVHTPRAPHRRGGTVSLRFPGDRKAKEQLAARGMICSWREGLRIGPHVYNTLDEIDAFMDALEALLP